VIKSARRALTKYALRTGKLTPLFLRFGRPNSTEYTEWLKRYGGLHSVGAGCRINRLCHITDPAFVRIGSNVVLGPCTLVGHNGGISVLRQVYGTVLDDVGKIDIKDNCFIGWGAIVLPGVTIGPNSIVAAGSVVNRDVPPGVVVGGMPARVLMTTDEYHDRLKAKTETLPWYPLLKTRKGDWEATVEPELNRQRVAHFYPDNQT
jgi:acetyltransferase-like isoleucine patch superfamily enzyme